MLYKSNSELSVTDHAMIYSVTDTYMLFIPARFDVDNPKDANGTYLSGG